MGGIETQRGWWRSKDVCRFFYPFPAERGILPYSRRNRWASSYLLRVRRPQISRGNGWPAQAASPLFAVIIKNFLVGEGAPQVVPTFGHLALTVYLTSAHSLSFLLVYEDSGLATWLSHSIASGDSGPGVIVWLQDWSKHILINQNKVYERKHLKVERQDSRGSEPRCLMRPSTVCVCVCVCVCVRVCVHARAPCKLLRLQGL